MEHEDHYRELVYALCDVQSGLTNWEAEFVSHMHDWLGEYSDKQKAKIQAIADTKL